MKLTTALCTLALASAQDGAQGAADSQGAQTQGAQTQGAQTQGAQGAQGGGYGDQGGEQAESYGGEQQAESYGEEAPSYGGEVHYGFRAPEVCLGGCPAAAPCQHATSGACVPKLGGHHEEAHYEAAQQSYGGGEASQQSGYRRLQDGGQQQSYGAAPAQSYGEAAPVAYAEAAPEPEGCPYGTVDTSHGTLSSTIVLWIAFALLFLPALFFFCKAFEDTAALKAIAAASGTPIPASVTAQAIEKYQIHKVIAGVICFVASLAYLTMASGYGYTVRCCDGRSFYYARYIDWTITTPLMLWEILDYSNAPLNERVFLYAADVLMIIGGLIGSLVCGGEKWAFFGFSVLVFIPILVFLCQMQDKVHAQNKKVFTSIMNITVVSWFFYPIVWILAEGTGTISADAEAICYTVLDIIAKTVMGFMIVNSPFAILVNGQTGQPGIFNPSDGSSLL